MASQCSVHKYRRVVDKKRGWIVYKCESPGCPHYLASEKLVFGRKTRCWKCDEVFILTKAYRRTARPKCPDCMGKVPREVLQEVDGKEIDSPRDAIKDLLERMAKDGL